MHRWLQGNDAPRDHDDDVAQARAELAELGLSPAQIEQQLGEWKKSEPKQETPRLVLPEDCREAVLLFVGCATQWDYITPGMGKPIIKGLNYLGVESVMRMRGIPRRRQGELLEDVRYMEAIALPLLS